MSAEEVKQHSARDYNPQVWEESVDRFMKYSNVQFYLLDRDNYKAFDEFFAIYTLPSGLRLLNKVSYSGMLSASRFYEIDVIDKDMDAVIEDVVAGKQIKLADYTFGPDRVLLRSRTDVSYNTTTEAREYMTKRSVKHGLIYTKQHIIQG